MTDEVINTPYSPGKHVLLDFFGASNLTDVVYIAVSYTHLRAHETN